MADGAALAPQQALGLTAFRTMQVSRFAVNPARYARLRELFDAASDLAEHEREAFLDSHCADDAELRTELARMFAAEKAESSGRLRLDTPAMPPSLAEAVRTSLSAAEIGEPIRVGEFRIVRKLGEGGMGVVYVAEQEHPRRQVALKLLREASLWPARLRRFQREANLLARLQHPGIARIYEAGVAPVETAAGPAGRQPFVALELIDGKRLGEYCADSQAGLREKLELVARIADAVHHAHCRGVIHRDLKPGNILVDAEGQPKILDFGISLAADAGDAATFHTEAGQLLGTIAYASPEQLSPGADNVDARSDVYALGVILFELLTGRLPIDVRGLTLPQAIQRVTQAEPASVTRFDRSLAGDVAAILDRALEKDPARRYASAAEFAADLRRHLRDEPIHARPSTPAVAARKFLRRHRAAVLSLSIAIAGALGGLSWGLIRVRHERDAARRAAIAAEIARDAEAAARRTAEEQRAIAEAVNQFLNEDILQAAGPDKTADRDLKLRDLLDRASETIAGRFVDQPLVEAAIRASLGHTYVRLGSVAAADPHLRRSLELRRKHCPPGSVELIESLLLVANLDYHAGRLFDAAALLYDAVAVCRTAYAGDHEATANALASLGFIKLRLEDFNAAERHMVEAIEMFRRLANESDQFCQALHNLGSYYLSRKRFEDAELALREALEHARRQKGQDHPDTINILGTLAALRNEQAKYAEAVPMLLDVLAAQSRVLGAEHPQTLITWSNLAFSFWNLNRVAEAEELLDHVEEVRRASLGPAHPATIAAAELHAALLRRENRLDEAAAVLLRAITAARDALGAIPPAANVLRHALGEVYAVQNRADDVAVWCVMPQR
jgi:serine/threonine protein kinase/tetratricopeptide (TPR) repeat protein